MKNFFLIGCLITIHFQALAVKLSDYNHYSYEVLFTNPICKTYQYHRTIYSNSDKALTSKPKNAYCTSRDSRASKNREGSPYKKVSALIDSTSTKELFLTYLSFSNGDIANKVCNAIRKRNVKVTLIIDSNNLSDNNRMKMANKVANCRPSSRFTSPNKPVVVTRGGTGGIGYAHNKLIFANPQAIGNEKVTLVFSSANMSSGLVTHHENWHIVSTEARSYFAQAHLCLRDGMLKAYRNKNSFSKFIKNCRSQISTPEESDIKTFFVPGEGAQALKVIQRSMSKASRVSMAAHRFSYGKITSAMKKSLRNNTDMRIVVDDDLYWCSKYDGRKGCGRNTKLEVRKLNDLIKNGLDARYMETYADSITDPVSLQLQHNKYIIFEFNRQRPAVFTGAGNFTGSAFSRNFENFYYITNEDATDAYLEQYEYFFNKLATDYKDMPKELRLP